MDRRERVYATQGNTDLPPPVEIEGSKAMNLAYYERREREFTDAEIRDDIISYLGEYRLNVQKYQYKLNLINSRICDPHQGEPLTIKAQRAIDLKKIRGENPYREEAELFGLQSGEEQLKFIKDQPATLFWVSPQGPKEEGYGDYGFVFVGRYDPFTFDISMTAIRIENPTIAQFNQVMFLLTGIERDFPDTVAFLRSPRVIRGEVDEGLIDKALQRGFSFKNNTRVQEIANKVFSKLEPKIEEFLSSVKHLSKEERLRLFHTLENYAISLKERYEKEDESGITILDNYRMDKLRLYDLSDKYGHRPPIVAGSCGSTGNTRSNGLFNFGFEALMKTLFGEDKPSACTVCGEDGSDGHYHCPNEECKKKYADETQKSSSDRTKKCSCGFEFGC